MAQATTTSQQHVTVSGQRRSHTKMHPFVFIAPSVLMLFLLLVIPILRTVQQSLDTDPGFGFGNYRKAFMDDALLRVAVRHTFIFAALSVIGQYLIGFGIALLMNERLPARGLLRVLFLIPWMFPAVVPGIVWRWMLDGQFGIINEILYQLNLSGEYYTAWLGRTDTSLYATIVANIWRGFPFMMILLLAGLQSINRELYEAASVDGANRLDRFRDITLPAMLGISFVCILLAWIGSFMNFAIVQVMTAGGPANSSEVMATLIYKNAFLYGEMEYASALGILLLLFLLIPGMLYVRSTMRKD
jgi:multiple sugar transport system permease protein